MKQIKRIFLEGESPTLKATTNFFNFLSLKKRKHSVIQGQFSPCLKEKKPSPLTFLIPGSPGSSFPPSLKWNFSSVPTESYPRIFLECSIFFWNVLEISWKFFSVLKCSFIIHYMFCNVCDKYLIINSKISK